MTLSRRLTEWGMSLTDIPGEVRHSARRHILDAVGNAVAGRRSGAVDYVVDEATTYETPAISSIFGSTGRFPPPMAALANGALIHALDFDDTHPGALIHGSAAVLPATLATAQERRAGFDEVIAAMTVGLEVTMRIGRLVPHGFHSRGFHATSVVGIFGATLASARLTGLDEKTTIDALGLAGSKAAGSLEFLDTGASTKQIHPGWAGLSALMCVRLAARGATGPESILEGRYGLFKSYLGVDVTASDLVEDLGELWESTRMTMKPYPVCQLSHATLDALRPLVGQFDPGSVQSIEVKLPAGSIPVVAEPRLQKVRPRSAYEAKFSVQWNVAALLIDGHLDIEHFTASQLTRPDVSELAERVQVEEAPFDGVPADAPGEVTVHLDDGRRLEQSVEASRGSPARPMSDAEVIEKFRVNVGTSLDSPDDTATAILRGTVTDADALFAMTEMR